MKAFKVIGNIIKGLNKPQKVLQGATIPNFKTIASKKGVINYNPTNVDYSNFSRTESNKVFVYPTTDLKDQEHYILFDIIERVPASEGGTTDNAAVGNTNITKRADNLNQVVYGANRFFSEGTSSGLLGIPTGKGSERKVKNTIAIYMPQTLKFNLQADYGSEEIGGGTGGLAKLKDAMNSNTFFGADLGAVGAQVGKLVTGLGSFATGGLGAGVGAAVQRRTGIAPAAMTEMIFNGIDYRTFSFTFKFTPRNRDESDVVNGLLHAIKDAMLPKRYGDGTSIAAYQVPHEFVIRFMKGTKINPYLDQIGLCACTGVEIDYGSDKFSTHPSGDPVSIDATLTFRELELMERTRYNELRISAQNQEHGEAD
jgi:hypothetical protein